MEPERAVGTSIYRNDSGPPEGKHMSGRLRTPALLAVLPLLAAGAVAAADAGPASAAPSNLAAAAGFHWSVLRSSPLGARSEPELVWTGKELVELGGSHKNKAINDGAAYVPATGRWHRIAPPAFDVDLSDAVTAWTGRQIFVINGGIASCPGGKKVPVCLPTVGLYNPATNRWTTTMLPRALEGLAPSAAVWTGHEVVVASTALNHSRLGVAAYNPATGRWRAITPRLPKGHPIQGASLVAAGGRLILWSLWSKDLETSHSGKLSFGVDVLSRSLGGGGWRNVTGNWPQNQTVPVPVPAGARILVSPGEFWCGDCPGPFIPFDGYFTNPPTLHRSIIPGGPLKEIIPSFVWTGREIIAVNVDGEVSGPHGPQIRPDDMALYNPATRKWTKLAVPPNRPGLDTVPVWADRELLTLTTDGGLLALLR